MKERLVAAAGFGLALLMAMSAWGYSVKSAGDGEGLVSLLDGVQKFVEQEGGWSGAAAITDLDEIYPAEFGGAFFNGSEYVVNVVHGSGAYRELERWARIHGYRVNYVANSLNRLNDTLDEVTALMQDAELDIVTVWRDDERNMVSVGVYNLDEGKEANIRAKFASNPVQADMLRFSNEETPLNDGLVLVGANG